MFTKEDYVSLETAKMLKEKGFDEPVLSQYSKAGSVWVCSEPENFNDSKDCFSRPTLYEAQKWILTKFGIHIWILDDMYSGKWIYCFEKIGKREKNNSIVSEESYNTFQQALDAGIREALKMI